MVTSSPNEKALQDLGVIVDVKNRVKSIKEKAASLGYEVKHTHCQELLAVALGHRNFHVLQSKEESVSVSLKKLLLEMHSSTVDPEYSSYCVSILLELTPEDYKSILNIKNVLDVVRIKSLDLPLMSKSFKNIRVEDFDQESLLMELGVLTYDSSIHTLEEVEEHVDAWAQVTKEGIKIRCEFREDFETITYTSKIISFEELISE